MVAPAVRDDEKFTIMYTDTTYSVTNAAGEVEVEGPLTDLKGLKMSDDRFLTDRQFTLKLFASYEINMNKLAIASREAIEHCNQLSSGG